MWVFMCSDVYSAVLGIGRYSGLISQGSQKHGGELFELSVSDAFSENFEYEVTGVAFDE